jgi:endonuclease/exonuclease/phosphatase family metal-dependent hydrolase
MYPFTAAARRSNNNELTKDLISRLLHELEDEELGRELMRRTAAQDASQNALVREGHQQKPLKIAAFNIQIYGQTKYGKKDVIQILIQILQRYDIILIQEIRDSAGDAITNLLRDLNNDANVQAVSGKRYEMSLSERLGDSNIKEQYAFFYNVGTGCSVVGTYQHPDIETYERDPYAAIFNCPKAAVPVFALMGIHTQPSEAVREIDALADAYDNLRASHGVEDVILMGDFNAGGSYVTDSKWSDIRLYTEDRFKWLITNDVDTTVASSNNAYDRFVVAGSKLQAAIVPGSAKAYKYDTAMNLNESMAKAVSDHYPIQVELYGKVATSLTIPVDVLDSVAVEREVLGTDLNDIWDTLKTGRLSHKVFNDATSGESSLIIVYLGTFQTSEQAITALRGLAPLPISDDVLDVMEAYLLDTAVLAHVPLVPGIVEEPQGGLIVRVEWIVDHVRLVVGKQVM